VGGYRDSEKFGAAMPKCVSGRYVKSTGGVDFVALVGTTFGVVNTVPKVGPIVINELHYDPKFGVDEFIELYNTSGAAVANVRPAHPANAWKFTNGIDFAFRPGRAPSPFRPAGYALVSRSTRIHSAPSMPFRAPCKSWDRTAARSNNSGESVELSKRACRCLTPRCPMSWWTRFKYDGRFAVARRGRRSRLLAFEAALGQLRQRPDNWKAGSLGGSPGKFNTLLILRRRRCQRSVAANDHRFAYRLSWSPSSDPQTQVARYIVYRDNIEIGQPTGNELLDLTVSPALPTATRWPRSTATVL